MRLPDFVTTRQKHRKERGGEKKERKENFLHGRLTGYKPVGGVMGHLERSGGGRGGLRTNLGRSRRDGIND